MRVLVDTSAWIDYFNGREGTSSARVQKALVDEDVVVGDLILAELLQGIRLDRDIPPILALWQQLERADLCGEDIALLAAANYRTLRRRGFTVRGTIDVIIATWCIANRATIIHNDRDMAVMERELGLQHYPG